MKRQWQQYLNKLRWCVLSSVFVLLLLIPFFYLYQTYVAAHAYDRLATHEKVIYDSVKTVTRPFIKEIDDLDQLKGTTWNGVLFGLKIADPLAFISLSAQAHDWYLPAFITILVPLIATLILGRFFCGWLCPATFIYELTDNLSVYLKNKFHLKQIIHLPHYLKYGVLALGILLSFVFGFALFAIIYPPAIIGRETFNLIALGGASAGILVFLLTVLSDVFLMRRSFCRSLCPGGALYSLLGKFRLVRVQRDAAACTNCQKCDAICQFHLSPLHDQFGMECNNCTACIQACPSQALRLTIRPMDQAHQGPGRLNIKTTTQTPNQTKNEQTAQPRDQQHA